MAQKELFSSAYIIMEYIKLNNGLPMPALGYGVFQIGDEETARCVADAIDVGYRLIDTAQVYQNERGVGEGIRRSGVSREDLFLTTKVWISNAGERKAAASIDESLQRLGTDYIDLLLIHQPYGDYYGTWRAMETALMMGKVRAVGVSNFSRGRFTDLAAYGKVLPAVNQVEANVFSQQQTLDELLHHFDTRIMAWAPLSQGGEGLFDNELLISLAQRHNKTVAQIALRWLIQRGYIAIPKTVRKERMQENFDVFDFRLSDEEMLQIAALNRSDTGTRDFDDPEFIKRLLSFTV